MSAKEEMLIAYEPILEILPKNHGEINKYYNFSVKNVGIDLLNSSKYLSKNNSIEANSKCVAIKTLQDKYLIWINLADKLVSFGCLIDNYEKHETAVFCKSIKEILDDLDVETNIDWHTYSAINTTDKAGISNKNTN